LLIVDEKRLTYDSASRINSNLIDSVYVLEGKEAILKYGLRARRGVIVGVMKKKLIQLSRLIFCLFKNFLSWCFQ
jgi:hypothetical protein